MLLREMRRFLQSHSAPFDDPSSTLTTSFPFLEMPCDNMRLVKVGGFVVRTPNLLKVPFWSRWEKAGPGLKYFLVAKCPSPWDGGFRYEERFSYPIPRQERVPGKLRRDG
ncbi:unnamed protein product [Victoria cruziana]